MVSQIKVNEIIKQSGSSITIGESGDTITLPSTATLTNFPTNTPAFHVYKSGNQSISNSAATNVTWDSEFYDTDSAFASNKFTVPSGKGGTYMFFWLLKTGTMSDTKAIQGWLQKNGSDLDSQMSRSKQYIPTSNEIHLTGHYTDVAVAGDYYEMRVFQDNGGAVNLLAETTSFWGYKLIGA
jgi:hypothetical protein